MEQTQLRQDRLREVAESLGWVKRDGSVNAQRLAHEIGMHKSTVARTVKGEYPVTPGFVGRLLTATGRKFDDLFEVIKADAA